MAAALVIHAAPGGETEALCREIAARRPGLPRLTLDDPENANLVALGFAAVGVDEVAAAWLEVRRLTACRDRGSREAEPLA